MKNFDMLIWILIITISTPIFYNAYNHAMLNMREFYSYLQDRANLISSFENMPDCQTVNVDFPEIWTQTVKLCNKENKIFTWIKQ